MNTFSVFGFDSLSRDSLRTTIFEFKNYSDSSWRAYHWSKVNPLLIATSPSTETANRTMPGRIWNMETLV